MSLAFLNRYGLDIRQYALVILRYEDEVRALIADSTERALEVRQLRVVSNGSWRYVAEECRKRWNTDVGADDTQSLGATLCHVAAEALGQDPDSEPWS